MPEPTPTPAPESWDRRQRAELAKGLDALGLPADASLDRLVAAVLADPSAPRAGVAAAVRLTSAVLGRRFPGATVEVRVPPFGAVQCGEGLQHTRGTPPNVVETDARTFLALAVGDEAWADVVAAGRVSASGSRADLTAMLPVLPQRRG